MKKFVRNAVCVLLSVLMCAGMLTGCKGRAVKVSVMKDASSVGLVFLMEKNQQRNNKLINKYKFSVFSTSNNAASAFTDKKADIAIVSADRAAKMAKADDSLVCLAYITTADYWIYGSTDTAKTIPELVGKSVYVNGANSIAATVLQYVYSQYNLNADVNTSIHYTKTNQALRERVLQGNAKECILISQPFASSISLSNSARELINIGAEFAKFQPDIPLIGACVVARKKYVKKNPERIQEFLSEYMTSIEKCNKDNARMAELADEYGLFSNSSTARIVFNTNQPKVVKGEEMKKNLSAYYQFMYEQNPLCIGAVPNDSFYYLP